MSGERFLSSRFWFLLCKVAQMLELSICWSLCSLPVITAGAALAALFSMLFRIGELSGSVPREFLREMKRHRRRAGVWWLGCLTLGALAAVDLTICMQNFRTGYLMAVLTGLLAGLCLLLCAGAVYLLGLVVCAEKLPWRQAAPGAFFLALRRLPASCALIALLGAQVWVLGRIWWIGFLFPAFFALPAVTLVKRALRSSGLLKNFPVEETDR